MLNNTIADLLATKGDHSLVSIGPDETVFAAVTRMVEHNIGAILVVEDQHIHGIMSERDYLRFVSVKGRTARDTPVRELMTAAVIYVTPETAVTEVMAIMTAKRIRHVPVMAGEELLGIVSIGDVVKQISRHQTAHIQVLEQYISDAYPGPSASAASN